jgi:nickel/cobalt transporter (NicO) family protein
MHADLNALLVAAVSIGFIHTVIGPDHYVPFLMIGRAKNWSGAKTLWVTFACGIAHVASSVVLGLIGIAFGVALARLEWIESVRGNMASWALIAFGLAYFAWGMKPVLRDRRHAHAHAHEGGRLHAHSHDHAHGHVHVHEQNAGSVTPWVLFTIFVLGPCEPLIPLLMYPAAKSSAAGLWLVAGVFAAVTVSTMLAMTGLLLAGARLLPLGFLEKYSHALAGIVIFATGLVIRFLGV